MEEKIYKTTEAQRASQKRSREKWKAEHGLSYDTHWAQTHKKKFLENQRRFREAHREHVVYRLDIDRFVYIGSTCDYADRISRHKTNLKSKEPALLYMAIEKFGWEAVTATILERNLPDKHTRLCREQFYIDSTPADRRLNTRRAISKKRMGS